MILPKDLRVMGSFSNAWACLARISCETSGCVNRYEERNAKRKRKTSPYLCAEFWRNSSGFWVYCCQFPHNGFPVGVGDDDEEVEPYPAFLMVHRRMK